MALKKIPYKGYELLPAKYDVVFKALFTVGGDLELLASLLSCLLDLDLRASDVALTNSELPPTRENGKLSCVDVRVKLADGKHINVEIQLTNRPGMEKRSVFYLSKLYTEQMTSGMEFREIEQAVAINILDFTYLPYREYQNRYRLKNLRNCGCCF